MNGFITTKRISWLAGAVALVAMALPSPALAGGSHLLKLYKVERHLDLEGQDNTYTVTCPNNDLALDGMWRVDAVEQDNDYVFPNLTTGNPAFDVLRSVRPIEVRGTPATDSSYDFRFTPESGGDVQMKLFVTCLGRLAESTNSHTHSWSLTTPGPVPANITTALTAPVSTTGACPTGILVQPGFRVNSGDADLLTSRPTTTADVAWQWGWDILQTGGFNADHYWKCLVLKSSTTNSHAHRIVKQLRTNDPAPPYSSALASSPPTVKKNSVAEVSLHCGDHYKGMVGGWNIAAGNPGYLNLWYLGMDPRIKSRAFRFINQHPVNAYRADLYLVCFKDKTT